MDAERIVERFRDWDLDPGEREYLRYHARRYALLTDLVERLRPSRLLDVGAGFQTALFRDLLGPEAVDVLGLWVPRFAPPEGAGAHHVFDLNQADRPDARPAIGGYDAAVMGEVLEHLFRGPATVLSCVAGFVEPGGHVIVQTPNAAAIHKRARLLLGRPPSGPMPEDRSGDAHVREYTRAELLDAGRDAGLEPVAVEAASYFGRRRGRVDLVLPRGLRLGLTVTFRRP
jgi:SAM-dependent methyltransferase